MKHRIENERSFHNKVFHDKKRFFIGRFYESIEISKNIFRSIILENCQDKKILEYGCGPWAESILYAQEAAEIVAIDISDTAINLSHEKVVSRSLEDKFTFIRMNAEEMEFEDESFDIIHGMGILHHLNLETAYSELSRVLKKNGFAIFLEPLGYNPIINLFRKMTPNLRTVDEHPILKSDIKLAQDFFSKIEVRYLNIFNPVAGIFPKIMRKRTSDFLSKVDHYLLKYKSIQKFAWISIIILYK